MPLRKAVLLLCPDQLCSLAAVFAFAGLAAIGRARCNGDRVRRYGEVVVSYVAVVRGGPFGAAPAVEGGEVEFVHVYGVVVAQAQCVYVEREFPVEPCLHAAVLVAVAGGANGVHGYLVHNTVPGAGGELFLRNGPVQIPFKIVAVFGGLPHEVDQLHGVAALAPHDACAPAVAGLGHGVAGVAFSTAESGELAAELELESVFEKDVVGAPHGVGHFHERLYDLRGAGGGVVVVGAYAALGVLELQNVAVLLAVVHDFRVFAVVLFHRIPPAAIVVVALEVFLGFGVAVYAGGAVFEVDERDGARRNRSGSLRECGPGKGQCCRDQCYVQKPVHVTPP